MVDGSKALRKAIRGVFGGLALVQRCQVHKQRNVLEHLPQSLRPSVHQALRQAWESSDVELARRQLEPDSDPLLQGPHTSLNLGRG